jgi:hypothetical protein
MSGRTCRGDCTSCGGVSIRSLIIDGNRPLLLRVDKGDALIELGNANGQTVEDCKLYEPRSVTVSPQSLFLLRFQPMGRLFCFP